MSTSNNTTVDRDASFIAVFRMSLESVVTLLLQYIVGALAAYLGFVSQADVPPLGTMTNLLLIPCLSMASLGRGLSVDVFASQGGWVLVIIGFASSLCYAAFGLVLRRLGKPDPEFRNLFVVMLAIPNVVAIPITLAQSLCAYGAFDQEFRGNRMQCTERAMAYVFLYVSLDAVNTFVFAYTYLAGAPTRGAEGGRGHGDRCSSGGTSRGKAALDAVDLQTSVQLTVPQSTVCVAARQHARSLLRKPPVLGMFAGLVIGLVPPVQAAIFSERGVLAFSGLAISSFADAAVPIINLMVAFSLGHKLKALRSWRDLFGSHEVGISSRTLLVLTLGRMIIMPTLNGLALYAMFGILPASRLLRVILFVEMAPPTASIVVMLTHLAEKPKLAQLCAFALVPQYLLVPLTLTTTLIVALYVTG